MAPPPNNNDLYIETCPDSHHCLHGSKCVSNPYDEGAYYCDCDEVIWDARYEGLYCEHKAEVYCSANGVRSHSFCTNGGTCVDIVTNQEAHLDCDCPAGYEGSYCQFVSGTKPDGWPYTLDGPKSPPKDRGTAHIWASLIMTLALFGIIAAFVYAYKRKDTFQEPLTEQHRLTGRDMELDPDGGDLKLAVEQDMRAAAASPPAMAFQQDLQRDEEEESGISMSQADKSITEDSMLSIT